MAEEAGQEQADQTPDGEMAPPLDSALGGARMSEVEAPLPRVTVRMTIAGRPDGLERQDFLADLVGERTVQEIMTNLAGDVLFTEAGALASHRDMALAVAALVYDGCRVLAGNGDEGDESSQGLVVAWPATARGADLLIHLGDDDQGVEHYLLDLRLAPLAARAPEEVPLEGRIDLLRRILRPKVDALDLTGLVRGNLQAASESLLQR